LNTAAVGGHFSAAAIDCGAHGAVGASGAIVAGRARVVTADRSMSGEPSIAKS